MSNTTKKLIAGLLMAATTFTTGSTCFANQVGFFNDGTGCETARCYEGLSYAIYNLFSGSISKRLQQEDDLMKKYYPEVFEKVDSAQKSIMECTDDNCIRDNLEKIIAAYKHLGKKEQAYIDNFNDDTRSELAERGLAHHAFWYKFLYGTNDILKEVLDKNRSIVLFSEIYSNFPKVLGPDFSFIESQKAIYDYYKNTAAELGFDSTLSHEELIAQLKECGNDANYDSAKWAIKLPTNNVLNTQNFYCAEPPTKFSQIKNKLAFKLKSMVNAKIEAIILYDPVTCIIKLGLAVLVMSIVCSIFLMSRKHVAPVPHARNVIAPPVAPVQVIPTNTHEFTIRHRDRLTIQRV